MIRMKVMFYMLLPICFFSCIFSCGKGGVLEEALEFAGENRAELESVLRHYREDAVKYESAVFLIENMLRKYSEDDRQFEEYEAMVDEWLRIKSERFYATEAMSDSLLRANGLASGRKRLYDLQNIKASYLINNIDRAVEAWTSTPWGQDIPFDVFCEEILPYRLSTEPLENWRDIVLEQYRTLYDSLRSENLDAFAACVRVFEAMGLDWDSVNKFSPLAPATNYRMIHKLRTGACVERVKYGIYVMRAFGIPVSWEYTPQWPNRSMGHDWASVRVGEGEYIPFIPTELKPGEPHKPDRRMAKAYRRTFSINMQSLPVVSKSGDIPAVFRSMCMEDVSARTFEAGDIRIPSENPHDSKDGFIYLCVFDNKSWKPVSWTKAGREVVFTDMGKDIVYLPVRYRDNTIIPCGSPFIFTAQSEIKRLKPDTTAGQRLKLVRKYPFLANWHVKMAGGTFEGANRPDFSDAAILHTVETDPDFYWCTVVPATPGAYRYYRYLSPDGGKGHIAELEFYAGKDSVRIRGGVIGTPGANENNPSRTVDKVFDGDVLTFFDAPQPDGAWAGMDFGKRETVTKIRYLPRNDDNIIVPGQLYELFYWDEGGWITLGQQKAESYVLYYDGAPLNALFLLRNLSKGKEGQVWY